MPWRIDVLTQRSEFVLLSKSKDHSHSELCRKYGISRTAGYKWLKRFEEEGLQGLKDRSRRPSSNTPEIPQELIIRAVAYRQAHPSWGATKIRKILIREFKKVPSRRTLHRVLQECNLIPTARRQRRRKVSERIVVQAKWNNHIWTADFKGWWRTRDGRKVFPLTIRDEYSKMILAIAMLPSSSLDPVKDIFRRCFEQFGLPEYIRTDNGSPFAFSQGLCGLSRLSAWWLKLGIIPNFIPPASPQFNGGHERMHRDMAKDLQSSPARNLSQQQAVAEDWRREFNTIRPHDALKDKTPSQVYKKSKTKYKIAEPALEYPSNMLTRFVTKQGKITYKNKRIFLSKAVGGENVGLEFTDSGYVNIWFGDTLLGKTDHTCQSQISECNLITGAISDTKITA